MIVVIDFRVTEVIGQHLIWRSAKLLLLLLYTAPLIIKKSLRVIEKPIIITVSIQIIPSYSIICLIAI